MAEYARVVTFDADEAALEALLGQINAAGGPPPGIPATRITVLADRSAGKVIVAVRFASEENLRIGAATLEGMSPPEAGSMRRTSVHEYEVALELQAPRSSSDRASATPRPARRRAEARARRRRGTSRKPSAAPSGP